VPYVRTVRTASGATAVQIVYSSHRGSRDIEHIGSAHDEVELELLKTVARQRLAAGQGVLDLVLEPAEPAGKGVGGGPLPITASRMDCMLDALEHVWQVLGLDRAAGGDEVFRDLVLARIIEPVSKLDSLRVLEEAGVAAASYRTVKRRLAAYAKDSWRRPNWSSKSPGARYTSSTGARLTFMPTPARVWPAPVPASVASAEGSAEAPICFSDSSGGPGSRRTAPPS
jgi:hypothetical protein